MASSYNMIGRPPIVAVHGGRARELVRRETITDLLSRDRDLTTPQPQPHQRIPSGCDALLHGE